MKAIVGFGMFCLAIVPLFGQVDTSFVYRTGTPYGTLDIRIAKSATRFYYLQENKTYSFRESSPGVRTDNYRDMTSWDSSPYTQGNLREQNGSQDLFVMNYRLLFPAGYNAAYSPGYPLILMVHGAGERANCWDAGCYWSDRTWKPLTNDPSAPTTSDHQLLNNDNNLLHGGEVHLNARNLAGTKLPNDPSMPSRAFPGFVLFPQNLNGWDANGCQDVIKLVRLVSKKYNIDENRIYVHGLSNGGYGVYEVLKRAPWLFAAAAPMSAISDASVTTYPTVLEEVSNIPFWIFQGGIDTNPVPSKTRGYVKKLKDAGAIVRYNEYSNLGHGVWNTAYNEPDFFTWLLSKNKSQVHVYADIAAICLTNGQGVRMSVTDGFLAYQWELNGSVISGADSPRYTATQPGDYRVRFSRVANPASSEWNEWSNTITITESNPAKAEVTQTGTVLLKDLNNYNNAHLHAVGEFAHYYWYKDSVLQDLPGNLDDTTQHPIFKAGNCTSGPSCAGNGIYTLVTAGFDNFPSPPSDPKYVYFNNQAPVNVNAPTSFTGSSISPSATSLNWTDQSSQELGFEIWRRQATGSSTFSKWSLAKFTTPDATGFTDNGLEPSTKYQYKMRAVATTGGSSYTPSASNQFLTIVTQVDVQSPTAPQNLAAQATGIKEVTLTWQGSSDDTGIRQYIIIFDDDTVETGNPATTYTLTNLQLNRTYDFTVRAIDLGGNFSDPSNADSADTYVTGLYYNHTTGAWSDLDQIDWGIAEYNGKVSNFTLAPRTQEDYFNFEFHGYLYIVLGGVYQFRTTSDDGSRLTLDSTVIVENDGLHGNITVASADQTLTSGPKEINVKFFEYTGGQTLIVQYRGPDTNNNWINIPDGALKSGDANSPLARMAIQPKQATTFNIYPNPVKTNGTVNVSMNGASEQQVRVALISMVGETLYEKIFESAEINEGAVISSSHLANKGIYLLIISHGDRVIKHRVVVD